MPAVIPVFISAAVVVVDVSVVASKGGIGFSIPVFNEDAPKLELEFRCR